MICECKNCEQTSKCEHRHDLGNCHKILGCPPNAWDGDKPSPAKECYHPEMCCCPNCRETCKQKPFPTKECEHIQGELCMCGINKAKTPPPDLVEEKIKEIEYKSKELGFYRRYIFDEKDLRELVELVRQERK